VRLCPPNPEDALNNVPRKIVVSDKTIECFFQKRRPEGSHAINVDYDGFVRTGGQSLRDGRYQNLLSKFCAVEAAVSVNPTRGVGTKAFRYVNVHGLHPRQRA
jgi:hypothetical protein